MNFNSPSSSQRSATIWTVLSPFMEIVMSSILEGYNISESRLCIEHANHGSRTHENPGSQAMMLYSAGVVLTAILPSIPFIISSTASGSGPSNSSGSKSTSGLSCPWLNDQARPDILLVYLGGCAHRGAGLPLLDIEVTLF